MIVTEGATNVSVPFYFVDDVGGTNPGEPTTGLLFSDIETGGSASYQRQGAARVDFELVTLASASASHADGGFILVDDTEMPGVYRCDIPDAAVAAGADFVIVYLRAASGNNTITRPLKIDLTTFSVGLTVAALQDVIRLTDNRPVWYVTKSGDNGNSGTSWDDSFETIGAAVTACTAGDCIRIGPGSFSELVNAAAKANLAFIGSGLSTVIASGSAGYVLSIDDGTLVKALKVNNTNGTSAGIYLNGKTDVVIEDVWTDSEMDAIYAAGSARLRMRRCHILCASDAVNLDEATDWQFDDTIIETDCTNSTSIEHRGIICDIPAGSSGVMRGGMLSAKRNDTGAADTTALLIGNHAGGSVTLDGVRIIAQQVNGSGSGDVHAVSSTAVNLLLIDCQVYTGTAGGGTAYDLKRASGTLAVDEATLYDTSATSGTITRQAPLVETIVDAVFDENIVTAHGGANTAGKFIRDTYGDTNTLQIEWADGGRLDLLLDAIPTTAMRGTENAATAAALATHDGKLDTVDGIVDDIVADTNELQADWANTGRLDTLLDAIPTTAMRGTENAATAASLATHDGKLDTVDSNVDAILLDTGTDGVVTDAASRTASKATSVLVSDKTGFGLASDGLDSIVIETGVNARQAISLIAAGLVGVLSGAATTTVTIKAADNSGTTRVVATVDADGNRSALTLTKPT